MKTSIQIHNKIVELLRAGPMPATELFDTMVVWLGGSRDYAIYRETEKLYGQTVRKQFQIMMEHGDIHPDQKMHFTLKEELK
ncbi:MAG TPA: hypothetical protein VEP90_02960 [Methylomirabilota bacterium]|nr:hypothetical protein [Methylomirabilota bacterium]